ncbi:MAG: pyrroline-5-carboxylate reductase [Zetaproteobacteria bacterium]|nr:MAG: pyrroline-5-carboxylate reductase [Zetaproteobacteria bacterium]
MSSSDQPYCATLIGCGKMGSAMMESWLNNNLVHHVNVIDPSPLPEHLSNDPRVHYYASYQSGISAPDILVLAVKPQILKEASQQIAQDISADTVLLSIAAGQSLATLEEIFGAEQPIIRTMPNTPAAIGKGISVSVANGYVTATQKIIAEILLSASGIHKWIDDEHLMDAVTALSGSGPAYIFHFIEALAHAGERLGLDGDLSIALARQTVIGSAALAEHNPDTSAATLRENVTSPGGTTQSALNILMDGRFQDLLNEALNAAKKRSQELG